MFFFIFISSSVERTHTRTYTFHHVKSLNKWLWLACFFFMLSVVAFFLNGQEL